MIEVAVRRLRPDARIPEQAYEGDAGLDLAACEDAVLEPGERAVVATGLAVEIPDGYAGFVQPRSGLAARHGIGIVNSPVRLTISDAPLHWTDSLLCAVWASSRADRSPLGPVTAAPAESQGKVRR